MACFVLYEWVEDEIVIVKWLFFRVFWVLRDCKFVGKLAGFN